jgi:hypothetical protein
MTGDYSSVILVEDLFLSVRKNTVVALNFKLRLTGDIATANTFGLRVKKFVRGML